MIPKFAVENRVTIGFCVALTVIGGIWAYMTMGRLEDPEFTIKTAIVTTLYPGATAEEVESRVTTVVERHIRKVKGIDVIRSISRPGLSIVYIDMRREFPPDKLPRAWQELRNKMGETMMELPVESLPPQVRDDFGDVFGILLALTGDGFTDSEIHEQAKMFQRELFCVDQVGRVELWGERKECIEVELSRAKMAELAVHPLLVVLAINRHNSQFDAGEMTVHGERIRINSGGQFASLEEIGNLIIPNGKGSMISNLLGGGMDHSPALGMVAQAAGLSKQSGEPIKLSDIATVRRTYADPPNMIMQSNGKSAVVLAIAPVSGGNVIQMGKNIRERTDELLKTLPVGYRLDTVCYQPDNVIIAIHAFEKNLLEAVIIVTCVVMLAMGWRSGLLITSSLLVVILGTLCVLLPMGVVLQRTSLGAFIVALGILVDDAVVVGDMILVMMHRGVSRHDACIEGSRKVGNQLLGATIVGALAFLPVYLSPDETGEYCRDLFLVLAISLGISWIVAMMQTPVVYYWFVHVKHEPGKDVHGGFVYQAYRRILEWTLHHKTTSLSALFVVLAVSVYGAGHIRQIFFPPVLRTQFMINYWLPEGASIHAVAGDAKKIQDHLLANFEEINQVSAFIGSGPPRFYLPYEPEPLNSSYAYILVNVKETKDVKPTLVAADQWLQQTFPQAQIHVRRFSLGPSTSSDVEVRFRGPDPVVLRRLAGEATGIFAAEPITKDVRDNWRQRLKVWEPVFSQTRGFKTLTSRNDMNMALRWATKGVPMAVYSEGDNLLPIMLRGTREERNDIGSILNVPIWGFGQEAIPLAQVISQSRVTWQDGEIHRRNGVPTITVGCNPAHGYEWNQVLKKVRPKIGKIELPPDYKLEWGGQYERSVRAESLLLSKLPIALVFMAIIVVVLFNALRQPLIILLTFPLAIIGITVGLLLTDLPFGFMALVGAMSLLGMIVRNGVVLMDQIDVELGKGGSPYHALVGAAVERLRPVTVAAMTVVVGMIPLLRDPLFNSMAAAIMFGLIFATVLTLIVVPILYMILFRIKLPDR